MRKSILLFFLLWSFLGYAQNDLYCLNDFAGWYRLSRLDAATGAITEIVPIPPVAFYVLGNKQCISTHDSTYVFSGHDGTIGRLYTVELATGNVLYNPPLGNVVVGLRYNCEDSTIYAMEENGGGYDLVKVDKTTGLTTQVGFVSGVSGYVGDSFVLDTKKGMYHFFGLFGSNIKMYTIDINTGSVTSSPLFPDNVTGLAYNCSDSTVYGLWEDGTDYKLEKINPVTGMHVTVGILNNIDPGFVAESSAVSYNGEYTYRGFSNSNSVLITVDVQTANVIHNVPFTSNISGLDYYACCSAGPVSSVDDVQDKILSVYPNPFTDKVKLQWSETIRNGSVELFDVYGKVVVSESNINGTCYNLKRGDIAKGLYFVEVKDGNELKFTTKLIAN